MLIYEKKVDGVRHLFGTEGNVPSNDDIQLTYKDFDGDTLTLDEKDTYLTDGKGGIIREKDGAFVAVFMGDKNIVPGKGYATPEITISSIVANTTKRFKKQYTEGEKLSLTGLTVVATYSDGSEARVNDFTTTPEEGTELTTSTNSISISYKGKTTTVDIEVVEAE